MLNFHYTAKQAGGELLKGEVQAESETAAAKLLVERGLFPIEVSDKVEGGLNFKFGSRVKSKDRILFTRQLATLIGAGLPLVQSLHTVRDQVQSKPLQQVIDTIISNVEGGSTLSSAFGAHPKVFNRVYVSLISAGEQSGTLDKALERLADQQEKDAAIISKVRGAMIYPVIVLAVVFGVLIFMLTTVLPQVSSLYKDLGKTLPFITTFLISISNFITRFWYIVILLLGGAIYALYNYTRSDAGRRQLDSFKMHVPLFGKLFMKLYMARYTRTMATLMAAGMPILEALEITKDAVNNVLIGESIDKSIKQVRGGKALSTSLDGDPNFLPLVPQMIGIGEKSGTIDDMLNRLAVLYETDVDEEVKNLSTTIEPVMIVGLAFTVGLIVLAVLLPVYGLIGQGVG